MIFKHIILQKSILLSPEKYWIIYPNMFAGKNQNKGGSNGYVEDYLQAQWYQGRQT